MTGSILTSITSFNSIMGTFQSTLSIIEFIIKIATPLLPDGDIIDTLIKLNRM